MNAFASVAVLIVAAGMMEGPSSRKKSNALNISSGRFEDKDAKLALSSQIGCRNENVIGGASKGSASVLRSGAFTLTWMECGASKDTCKARLISEGVEVMPSLPLSRIFVMKSRSEAEMSNSLESGNMAKRRSNVEI